MLQPNSHTATKDSMEETKFPNVVSYEWINGWMDQTFIFISENNKNFKIKKLTEKKMDQIEVSTKIYLTSCTNIVFATRPKANHVLIYFLNFAKHVLTCKLNAQQIFACLQHFFSATIIRLPRSIEDISQDVFLRQKIVTLKTSWRNVCKKSWSQTKCLLVMSCI